MRILLLSAHIAIIVIYIKVVHKYSERPSLEEVEQSITETRDIVFRLKFYLDIQIFIIFSINYLSLIKQTQLFHPDLPS